MRKKNFGILLGMFLVTLLLACACKSQENPLIGTWKESDSDLKMTMDKDGNYILDYKDAGEEKYTYKVDETKLRIINEKGVSIFFNYKIDGDVLELDDGQDFYKFDRVK